MYIRDDFEILTPGGKSMKTSFFYPERNNESERIHQFGFDDLAKDLKNIPTVIYLHSQSGSRLEGLFLLDFCAENGYALCLFDFLGCGLSQGDYVKFFDPNLGFILGNRSVSGYSRGFT